MGIDIRPSYGLRHPSYQTNSLPVLPESPSSLPDTSSQTSTSSSHSSNTSWSQTSQPSAQGGANVVPAEQRQNPRRSSSGMSKPPTLVRQDERKVSFVDSLVDSATQMVEVIWPLSVAPPPCRPNTSGVLSLRRYIEETLRRSRTSYSTLQVALYYLVLIMPLVPKCDFTREQLTDSPMMRSLQCGRRMFLAALILASKYLQDRNYSAKAWSKMSGLKVAEINMNERAFLQSVNWKLHIPDNIFKRWTDVVLRFTPSQFPPPPGHALLSESAKCSWREIIPLLTPELDTVSIAATTTVAAPESASVQTPFASLPSFLEPEPEVAPPTPAFVGTVASLPTPRSTPPRSFTPAVSVASVESWPLMRAPLSRRPSTVSLTGSSIGSSPESTYSDASRLSRSSSISSVSTSATSVSSQSSASAEARLAKLATCRNSQLYAQSLSYTEAAALSQPAVVINDGFLASPISITYNEDLPLTTEDAPLSRASRAVKRSYSERDDGSDCDSESLLQMHVGEAIREQWPTSVPVVVVEDKVLPRLGCDLQYNVQQMLLSSRRVLGSRKRACVSVR